MLPSFASELRDLRRARSLRLTEAAARIGVSRVTLQRWETEASAPSVASLERLLSLYKVAPGVRARLLAAADPRHARIVLARSALGAPVNVGMVLRAMRLRQGMTQSALAKSVRVTQATVSKWESGDAELTAETIHSIAYALGAAIEETLALASARDTGVETIPWDIEEARLTIRLKYLPAPLALKEVISIGWEAEMWRRASRDPRWEPLLARVLAYRANELVLELRYDEIPALAKRVFRLATTVEGRVEAVPVVAALGSYEQHRRNDRSAGADEAGVWAARIPESEMRAWLLRAQGMGLARRGRAAESLDLVRRSLDMDAKFLGTPSDPHVAWRSAALPMAEAYLAAGIPERAAETMFEKDFPSNPALLAEIAHAQGRLAKEDDLREARRLLEAQEVAAAFAYSNRSARRRVARIEKMQAKMLRRPRSVNLPRR